MVDHRIHAPLLGLFDCIEDWSIERLPDAEHAAFASIDGGTIAGDEFSHVAAIFLSLKVPSPTVVGSKERDLPYQIKCKGCRLRWRFYARMRSVVKNNGHGMHAG